MSRPRTPKTRLGTTSGYPTRSVCIVPVCAHYSPVKTLSWKMKIKVAPVSGHPIYSSRFVPICAHHSPINTRGCRVKINASPCAPKTRLGSASEHGSSASCIRQLGQSVWGECAYCRVREGSSRRMLAFTSTFGIFYCGVARGYSCTLG